MGTGATAAPGVRTYKVDESNVSDSQRGRKKETIETLLEKGMVMITLDARHEEASLPEYLTSEPQLVLNISTRFNLPLDITDWGVHATLTFRGSAFNCEIPWNAIYIMVSHETREPFLFPDDIPVEVVAETIRREREEEEQMQLNEPDRGQGFGGSAQLRLVETDGAAPIEIRMMSLIPCRQHLSQASA